MNIDYPELFKRLGKVHYFINQDFRLIMVPGKLTLTINGDNQFILIDGLGLEIKEGIYYDATITWITARRYEKQTNKLIYWLQSDGLFINIDYPQIIVIDRQNIYELSASNIDNYDLSERVKNVIRKFSKS